MNAVNKKRVREARFVMQFPKLSRKCNANYRLSLALSLFTNGT